MRAHLDCQIRLSGSLYVAPDVLGHTFGFQLGPWSVELGFPALPADLTSDTIELCEPWPPVDAHVKARLWGWGIVGHGIPKAGERLLNAQVHQVAAKASAHDLPEHPEPDTANRFGEDLERWAIVAGQWLTLWSDQAMTHMHPPEFIDRIDILVRHDAEQVVRSGWSPRGSIYIDPPAAAITREIMAAAASRAAAGDAPPLPWRLFIADPVADSRRKIIDLATAVEVALAEAIKAGFGDQPAQLRERVILQANGITGLYQLWLEATTHTQGETPSVGRIRNQLADPRNQAAHGGRAPDHETLKKARETARRVLDLAAPLPAP